MTMIGVLMDNRSYQYFYTMGYVGEPAQELRLVFYHVHSYTFTETNNMTQHLGCFFI